MIHTSIKNISFYPNRFGRMIPTLFLNLPPSYANAMKNGNTTQRVFLDSYTVLLIKKYRPGDIIEYCPTKFPILGDVIKSHPIELDYVDICHTKMCPQCDNPLIESMGQYHQEFYCRNPSCQATVFFRAKYAVGSRCLQLHTETGVTLGDGSLKHLIWDQDAIVDVTDLFFASDTTLACLRDIGAGQKDISHILEALNKRLTKLYAHDVTMQKKYLDALSIYGMNHGNNLYKIVSGLVNHKWAWEDLPNVITDPQYLGKLGIPHEDRRLIIDDATARLYELESLAQGTRHDRSGWG